MRNSPLVSFLALAFGISWSIAGIGAWSGVDTTPSAYVFVAGLCMLGPAAAAIIPFAAPSRGRVTDRIGFKGAVWGIWRVLLVLLGARSPRVSVLENRADDAALHLARRAFRLGGTAGERCFSALRAARIHQGFGRCIDPFHLGWSSAVDLSSWHGRTGGITHASHLGIRLRWILSEVVLSIHGHHLLVRSNFLACLFLAGSLSTTSFATEYVVPAGDVSVYFANLPKDATYLSFSAAAEYHASGDIVLPRKQYLVIDGKGCKLSLAPASNGFTTPITDQKTAAQRTGDRYKIGRAHV